MMSQERFIKVAVPMAGEDEAAAVRDVILSGNYVAGEQVRAFEAEFANYIGTAGASALNSGTAALHVALALLGIGAGDEVIVPALSFMSSVTAVFHQNAIPVFADIDPKSFCMDPEDIENRLTERTKAIIPVHLFGNAAEMDDVMEIARRRRLFVIEDCAQAHGTEYRGHRVGRIGHIGAFSFFATKHMTTGEGGMITSDNPDWIEQSRQIRSHGMVGRDTHAVLGYNYRMNEMAAAMGRVQLRKLDAYNRKRIDNSLYLLDALSGSPQGWYRVPVIASHINHTFFWCPLIIDEKIDPRAVIQKLRGRGVEVRHRYFEPLYKQKVIQDRSPYPGGCPFSCIPEPGRQDYARLHLPNVERITGRIIGLPNHPALTAGELDYIVDTVSCLY